MCVRKPAGRFFISRSTPIAPPSSIANAVVARTLNWADQLSSRLANKMRSSGDPLPSLGKSRSRCRQWRRTCALRQRSGCDQAHPGEIALADLQHALEARHEHGLRVFDDFAIDAHG